MIFKGTSIMTRAITTSVLWTTLVAPAAALELTRTAPTALSPKPVAPVAGVVFEEDFNEI